MAVAQLALAGAFWYMRVNDLAVPEMLACIIKKSCVEIYTEENASRMQAQHFIAVISLARVVRRRAKK
jgi:hypothetical protein